MSSKIFSDEVMNKTIEQLENRVYGPDTYGSTLTTTVHALRKKKIKEFNIENLRIMIGQHEALKYLVPLALERLKKDILAAGDYYGGDLLSSVLTVPDNYWKEYPDQLKMIKDLLAAKRPELGAPGEILPRKLVRLIDSYLQT